MTEAVTHAAIAKYQEAIAICPTCAAAYIELASAVKKLGDKQSARAHAERALELRPTWAHDYIRLRFHFDGEEARRVLREGFRVKPNRFERDDLALNIAMTYWYEGRFEEEARVYRRLLRAQREYYGPRSSVLHLTYSSLGQTLEAMNDFVGAERAYRAILPLGRDRFFDENSTCEDIVLARLRSGDLVGARAAMTELADRFRPRERMLFTCFLRVLAGEPPKCPVRLLKIIEKDESQSRHALYGAIILHALGRDELALPRLRALTARWERNRREWAITLRWEIAYAKRLLAAVVA